MTRILRGVLWVGVGLLAWLPPQPPEIGAQLVPLRLVSSTPESLVFEFVLPEHHLEQVSIRGETFTQIRVDGLSAGGEPGAPQLPRAGTLIGLPPLGEVSLRVVQVEETRLRLAHLVCPEPVLVLDREAAGASLGRQGALPDRWFYEHAPDPDLYAQDGLYPGRVVELGQAEWVRDHRLARVTIHPVRYNPLVGELVLVRRLVVEIAFADGAHTLSAESPGVPSPVFEDLLSGLVLNDESLRDWRAPPGLAPSPPATPGTAEAPSQRK